MRDHVNPYSPWPDIRELASRSRNVGKHLTERLCVYPHYVRQASQWIDKDLLGPVSKLADADGFARDHEWAPGLSVRLPDLSDQETSIRQEHPTDINIKKIIKRALNGENLETDAIVTLFRTRGAEFLAVCEAADRLRQKACGDDVTYVVNRNINFTNICRIQCAFCAFCVKTTLGEQTAKAYVMDLNEIGDRAEEAWRNGATEVCLQGGIHPEFNGQDYIDICRIVKEAAPDIHIHAFSPMEISTGAKSLGLDLEYFLLRLKTAGLGSIPGTAAEVLNDKVRAKLCPGKLSTNSWHNVVRAAHGVGIPSSATIMFGHVDDLASWADHLLLIRALQQETGMITEFVPLPFVHMQSPIYQKGKARRGPTFREVVLMHAVSRLVLNPLVTNIQTSWPKLGEKGAIACLRAGANDLGGTLMDESISKCAGSSHGQKMSADRLKALISSIGRIPRQRTTTYGRFETIEANNRSSVKTFS